MTDPTPTKPDPYIPDGSGWLFRVRVPGHGLWERDPGRASMFYAVYEQAGRDYHITINSGFLTDHSTALGTHISSNAEIAGSRVHWPDPGVLSPPQQAWLTAHNVNQFNALLAAFSQRLRLCAASIEPSRRYDAAVAERRTQRFAETALRYQVKEDYLAQLKDWVLACPQDAYLQAFRYKTDYYFLDLTLGVVVHLEPVPLEVVQGEALNGGFVSRICMPITSGTVESLTGVHISNLTSGVTLLYIVNKKYAMLTTDFDACEPDGNMLSMDQVVDLAVTTWIGEAASGRGCEAVAFDKLIMNVIGPASAQYHLMIEDLLDEVALEHIGIRMIEDLAPGLHLGDLPNGVYLSESCTKLIAQLPPILRVKHGKINSYILLSKLVEGWSDKLTEATVPNLAVLAQKLPRYQIWAEELAVENQCGVIIYLWPDSGGKPLFVGLPQHCFPGAQVRKGRLVDEQADQVSGLFAGGLTASEVVVTSTAIVISKKDGQPFKPPICVDKSTMAEFDYKQAQNDYLVALEAQKKREAEAKSIADAQYENTWQNIQLELANSTQVELAIYLKNNGKILAVPTRGRILRNLPDMAVIGSILITRRDARYRRQNMGLLEFICADGGSVKIWFQGLFTYVAALTLELPQGIDRYLLTLR